MQTAIALVDSFAATIKEQLDDPYVAVFRRTIEWGAAVFIWLVDIQITD
jgi:hypothetical protein